MLFVQITPSNMHFEGKTHKLPVAPHFPCHRGSFLLCPDNSESQYYTRQTDLVSAEGINLKTKRGATWLT